MAIYRITYYKVQTVNFYFLKKRKGSSNDGPFSYENEMLLLLLLLRIQNPINRYRTASDHRY